MADNIAVSVNSISKTYKLYKSKKYRILELVDPFRRKYHTRFNALSDVSFQVEKGEVIGIIGQNGSGKSTLLKILASVATPTAGSFQCNGKVTALLELGGGFNKDLTGIENIYYIGALQGYSKKEMTKKVEKILEFADIGQYAYQPVNTYSSGMYVRLAFSMTINIDPDILITDEALSVGDIRFQQKCYRRIRELKESGKTIIICTHNLGTVRDFCNRAIWLNKGKLMEQGDPVYVTDCYNAFMISTRNNPISNAKMDLDRFEILNQSVKSKINNFNIKWQIISNCETYGTKEALILSVAFTTQSINKPALKITGSENVGFSVLLNFKEKIARPDIQLVINGPSGLPVLKISNLFYEKPMNFPINKPSIVVFEFILPGLGNGKYSISAGILSKTKEVSTVHFWVHDAVLFEVANHGAKFSSGAQIVLSEVNIEKVF